MEVPPRRFDASQPDAVRQAVGGLMEAIDLPKLGITMYVNESGFVERLPLNRRATWLLWQQVPSAWDRTYLVGDVALVGLTDDEGEDTSLPLVFEELVLGTHLLRVESRYEDNLSWWWNDETYDNYWEALRQAITKQALSPERCETRVAAAPTEATSPN
ncbi:DUF3846 domain-containing protein [Microbacterium sorbitolivorans]